MEVSFIRPVMGALTVTVALSFAFCGVAGLAPGAIAQNNCQQLQASMRERGQRLGMANGISLRALGSIEDHKAREALTLSNQALAYTTNSPGPYISRGLAELMLNDAAAAYNDFRQSLALTEADIAAVKKLEAMNVPGLKDLTGISYGADMLLRDPSIYNMAFSSLVAGSPQGCIDGVSKLKSLAPSLGEKSDWLKLEAMLALKQYDGVLKECARPGWKDTTTVQYFKARALLDRPKKDQADKSDAGTASDILSECIKQVPGTAMFHLQRARALQLLEKNEEAVIEQTRAAELGLKEITPMTGPNLLYLGAYELSHDLLSPIRCSKKRKQMRDFESDEEKVKALHSAAEVFSTFKSLYARHSPAAYSVYQDGARLRTGIQVASTVSWINTSAAENRSAGLASAGAMPFERTGWKTEIYGEKVTRSSAEEVEMEFDVKETTVKGNSRTEQISHVRWTIKPNSLGLWKVVAEDSITKVSGSITSGAASGKSGVSARKGARKGK